MDLSRLDASDRHRIVREYRANAFVLVPDVRLPPAFSVATAEVVLLQGSDGKCEVHLSSQARYSGRLPQWRAIDDSPEIPGGTRLVATVAGDGQAALAELSRLLDLARGEDADEPLQGQTQPPLRQNSGLPDLVAAQRGQPRPFAGREELLPAIAANLCRLEKPGIVLLGAPGVGKTTLVHMLAWDLANDPAMPASLRDVPVLELALGNLTENAGKIGGLEREVRRLLEQPGRPIFFVDEIHQLVRPELAPLRDLLKPQLADGRIRVLAATTPDEWRQLDDEAFKRRFAELTVAEPSCRETARMIAPRVARLAAHHCLSIDERATREAILLADRHLPLRRFPDKALDVIDVAAALQSVARDGDALLAWHLHQAAAKLAGTAVELVDPAAAADLASRVEQRLRQQLRGQETAIEQLSATLHSRLAMRTLGWEEAARTLDVPRDRRPLATLLACGPTGVGKTQTARAIAHELFGGNLILLHGSDVGPEAPHGTAAWVGSPPGYVGSQRGGTLTRGLRETPAAVVCIDELEKASPEAVQNILLPLLGDGIVTDRNDGRTLWASACVVLCTSNLAIPVADGDAVFAALNAHLRPEVVARFHAVLRYVALGMREKWQLWSDLRGDLQARLGARLQLDEAARRYIEAQFVAWDDRGARGVEDLFAEQLVPLVVGVQANETVAVTCDGKRLARVVEAAS